MRKFMRTRAADGTPPSPPPPAHLPDTLTELNGHAHKTNGRASGAADHHSALSSALFEDAAFPATWRALGRRRRAALHWPRPHELCARPRFLGDDVADPDELPDDLADRHDVTVPRLATRDADVLTIIRRSQKAFVSLLVFILRWRVAVGEAGDAHVCVAAAALALAPRLLARAAPPHSFRARYTGAFRFRFWVFGEWRDVVVDDRLPARSGRLLSSRAAHDDFTLPLLEKAYAKLHGSYAALRGGSVARALQELSGGIVQSFALIEQPRALTFQVLNSAVPRSTLLVASARAARAGLLPAQPYVVTGLARVRHAAPGGGAGALVRVRAVGGAGAWAGAWSPHSAERRALAPPDRDLLQQRADAVGEFWMSFGDFVESFSQLELVHVGPDDWLLERALHAKRPWRAVLARRRWRAGYNAGGPPHCSETTGANPQFHVQIPHSETAGARKCHVVVSVTQQYEVGAARARRLHAVGFALYELPAGARLGHAGALRGLRPLDVTHESRAREVVTFFTLPPGRYLLVPHTRRPHTDAAFLLRVLTDELTDVWEVNEDNLIIRDVLGEFLDEAAAARAGGACELDAAGLRAALRREWRACLCARPSLELCRALVPLRDRALAGCMAARDVPALVALLACWRRAFLQHAARRCGAPAASSYGLRALLRAAGVSASNKVLECLVLRYARAAHFSEEAYVMALARLHLAHERYRSLDSKMKCNPLSLEEMILMTIYS